MKTRSKWVLGTTVFAAGAILVGACAPKPQFLDADGDGVPRPEDCFDDDPNTYPGAEGGATCIMDLLLGLCRDGKWQCETSADGLKPVCVSSVPAPVQEEAESKCNAKDDDCDGSVDEGCACDPGRVTMCGIGMGECKQVQITCPPQGRWPECPAQQPAAEICNGLDDDCDGLLDEEFPEEKECQSDQSVGACRNGRRVCEDGQLSCAPGEAVAELCNGIDDNCDGSVDENFPTKGQPCNNGLLGVCRSSGNIQCNNAGDGVECVYTNAGATPGVEVCDDLDNDCNGSVDENFPDKGTPCDNDLNGVCYGTGYYSCNQSNPASGLVCTLTNPGGAPAEEICDNLDNDCNGLVDDSVGVAGAECQSVIDLPDLTVFPLLLQSGDPDFDGDGNGPFVQIEVNVECGVGAVHVEACVTMAEVGGAGDTVAHACYDQQVPVPGNWSCTGDFDTTYLDTDHYWDNVEIATSPPLVTSIECLGDTTDDDVCTDPNPQEFCGVCHVAGSSCSSCPSLCSGCVIRLGHVQIQQIP